MEVDGDVGVSISTAPHRKLICVPTRLFRKDAGQPTLSPSTVAAIVAVIRTGQDRDAEHGTGESSARKYRFTGYKKFLDPDGSDSPAAIRARVGMFSQVTHSHGPPVSVKLP
jgi:hypothetical protein